ncbi:MAG: pyridoxamine 5'-phosphate oxidase [Acidobacteria bacterium]|nr:pyridoxamine 5'-phosphate oxidase [Acidobacteriota bacterium]
MAEQPIKRFHRLQQLARSAGEAQHATAMTLATCDADGNPTARMVLLKSANDDGFVFYTNYESRKAAHLDQSGHAALVFYWATINVQIRVEGTVSRGAAADADAYFASRPRQSQLGAWASVQSQPLANRRELIGRYLREKAQRLGQPVPRPPHWGGYVVTPERIEFWQSRLGRLHDRHAYTRAANGEWSVEMLYP